MLGNYELPWRMSASASTFWTLHIYRDANKSIFRVKFESGLRYLTPVPHLVFYRIV